MSKEEAPSKKARARSEAPADEQTDEVDEQDAAEMDENSPHWFSRAVDGINRTIYKTGYYLSYGVVFPTCFLAGLVPIDNAMGRGLLDGAGAARDAVQQMRNRSTAGDESPGDAEPAAA